MERRASVVEWLDSLAVDATPSEQKLRHALARGPSRASYSSISEIAGLADLNAAAVTRAAQRWGFAGWPALRVELRARYLESLSLSEVASERRTDTTSDPVTASLDADRRALLGTSSALDIDRVRAVAQVAARARRRVALGSGSYRALADLTATYFALAGYPTTSPADASGIVGSLVDLREGDLVIGFDLWRGYVTTIEALRLASERGALVCLVTDRGESHLDVEVDFVLHVASESSTFFPTLVPAVALVNAIAAELAVADPVVTDASSLLFEEIWERLRFDKKR